MTTIIVAADFSEVAENAVKYAAAAAKQGISPAIIPFMQALFRQNEM